jgi:hypothetical protein
MTNKPITEVDAATLYTLAREKEREERRLHREHVKTEVNELKAQRKEKIQQHRVEIAQIDRSIELLERSLFGRRKPKAGGETGAPRRRRKGAPISNTLLAIIGERPEMAIADIREKALAAGLTLKTVTQMLAYLKRTGRLSSPRHGFYMLREIPGTSMTGGSTAEA